MKLDVNHNTFQTWRYRSREMRSELYLQEFVLFERLLNHSQRCGDFIEIAQSYYSKLCELEPKIKSRYLKERGIVTVDDFYSHLYLFLHRYRKQGREETKRELFLEKKKRDDLDECELHKKIMKQTTRGLRQMIHEVATNLDSKSSQVVMRAVFDHIETRESTTGLYQFMVDNEIKSTSEFLKIIQFVIENPCEFVDVGYDL